MMTNLGFRIVRQDKGDIRMTAHDALRYISPLFSPLHAHPPRTLSHLTLSMNRPWMKTPSAGAALISEARS